MSTNSLRAGVASWLRHLADHVDVDTDDGDTGDDPRSESYHALPDALKEADNLGIPA